MKLRLHALAMLGLPIPLIRQFGPSARDESIEAARAKAMRASRTVKIQPFFRYAIESSIRLSM